MLPEITSKMPNNIGQCLNRPRYVSLYRQNATRLQLKLLKQYLCDESTPFKLKGQQNCENGTSKGRTGPSARRQLKKYITIDHISTAHKYYEDHLPFRDENEPAQPSMKKLSELIEESSLPFIKKYVKKSKKGVADKLITCKIR